MRRVITLDLARGIAILGTLGTNIWIFSHPEGLAGYLTAPQPAGQPVWATFAGTVLAQLTNGKFLGLLTLMFGIGLAIQADAAQRRGRPWPGPYGWRAALLFLDGLLHYLLVVEFDVLMGYAVTGAIVAYIITTSPRTQRRWIIGTAAAHLALMTALTVALWTQPAVNPGPLDPNPYRDGSWWDLVVFRIDNAGVFRAEPVLIGALSIAMFTLGNTLWRAGLFAPEGAGLRRRLMIIGAVALPVDLLLGASHANWFLLTRYGTAPLVALGILATIAGLRDPHGWWVDRLSELGRVALSGYITQNVVASVLFYGWGLDLGGVALAWRFPLTVAAWVGISALIITGAHVWLRYHRRGPVEWLWHRAYEVLSGVGGGRSRRVRA